MTSGYSWSFPAGDEVRVGVGSFDPRIHVKEPTLALAADEGIPAERFQGNWIPHQLRPATQDGVFFAGDSAGHCLPTTAEGIRTALYFGLALGRELRAVLEGGQTRDDAPRPLRRLLGRARPPLPLAAARAGHRRPRRAARAAAARRPRRDLAPVDRRALLRALPGRRAPVGGYPAAYPTSSGATVAA